MTIEKESETYNSPLTMMIRMNSYGLMDSLSMNVSDDPAIGASDAKKWDMLEDDFNQEEDAFQEGW
ncbi:MAG: hypothetical protein PUH24_00080 [Prevotellaceae bacterium]|nr:hypothetical protein [Prevotella sp.]MDD7256687.1 hypothetical protein [Prevotellaceae bacterium]MDY6131556.1 hypothetical protein [Prevotella sp.]